MIESGDIGKAVEVWQKIVGVKEDGEFGPKTKAATLAFQRAKWDRWSGKLGSGAEDFGISSGRAMGEILWSFFVYSESFVTMLL